MSNYQALVNHHPLIGKVTWIGIRPKKRGDIQAVQIITVDPETGIEGDHYQGRSHQRQVTLLQQEHLEVVSNLIGRKIEPHEIRRNLLIEGINLLALIDRRFHIGDEVILETTGHCHPCSRMEENLGTGGYQAMRGHGGITARVIRGGNICIGDQVSVSTPDGEESRS